jgi:hypothetical protein
MLPGLTGRHQDTKSGRLHSRARVITFFVWFFAFCRSHLSDQIYNTQPIAAPTLSRFPTFNSQPQHFRDPCIEAHAKIYTRPPHKTTVTAQLGATPPPLRQELTSLADAASLAFSQGFSKALLYKQQKMAQQVSAGFSLPRFSIRSRPWEPQREHRQPLSVRTESHCLFPYTARQARCEKRLTASAHRYSTEPQHPPQRHASCSLFFSSSSFHLSTPGTGC